MYFSSATKLASIATDRKWSFTLLYTLSTCIDTNTES
uniref:Uncharacterized protein n=1 Tax=Anguilla anguilla TaxID=7936 RepID=A0A0E9VUN8_ANGAN